MIENAFKLPARMKYQYGNIPVVYEIVGQMPNVEDYLPSYLVAAPSVGDIIESTSGNRYEVKEIVHMASANIATLKLSIGKPSGGITPMEGGAGADTNW